MDKTPAARLPLHDLPLPDESINGYLARMAGHNHLPKAKAVADAAGIEFPEVCYGDEAIERLAIATGQKFETLRPIAPDLSVDTALGKTSSLLGHEVPTDSLVRVGRRVCPLCLLQAPHHRISWSFRFVRFCTEHGCRLVKACPKCGKDLDWVIGKPEVCRCGHELFYQPATGSIEGAVREEIPGPKYLLEILSGTQKAELPMLTGLNFAQIFFAARRLGHFGADRSEIFWLDDMMHDAVGIWLTRALRLLALNHGRFVDKLIALLPKRDGMPTKKHLGFVDEVRTKLSNSGAAEAPLVIALEKIVDRYPRVLT